MKTIKFAEGTRVITENHTKEFRNGNAEMWKYLRMDSPIYEEARLNITRELFCFHRIDLTEAYGGHKVIIELIPVEE